MCIREGLLSGAWGTQRQKHHRKVHSLYNYLSVCQWDWLPLPRTCDCSEYLPGHANILSNSFWGLYFCLFPGHFKFVSSRKDGAI